MNKERSLEVSNLLNPAFCGVLFLAILEGYNSKSSSQMPIYLPYVLMPLVLHKETRIQLPSTSVTKFQVWINSKDNLKIGLTQRIKNLKPFVSEAIVYLHSQGLITVSKNFKIIPKNKGKTILRKSQTTLSAYIKPAKTLGSICARTNSDATVLALLGVKI